MEEHRYKLALITPEEILHLFTWTHTGILRVLGFEEDIRDAEIRGINYLWDHHAFAIRLYHPDWDEVPAGQQIPLLTKVIKEISLEEANANLS